MDDWQTTTDTPSERTSLGLEYVDIRVGKAQQAPVRFTFYWTEAQRWEGQDYEVAVVS
jgi:glucoamylase